MLLTNRLNGARLRLIALALTASLALACGGRPFDVKPKPDVAPSVSGPSARLNGITIQAEAVTDEDFLNDTFDANLILAGILPVQVMMKNDAAQPVELKKARFEITAAGNRKFKMLDARRAFKRLISFYEISTYSKDGYKKSEADFSSYAFDTGRPLGAGESRTGMIFFMIAEDYARMPNLTLAVSRIGDEKNDSTVELKLN
ncbi:MAG TPA: hypothetical protein VNN73_05025 [Blastocatellia bacterium]|nr:hypothetical protein [Blastocatellia bacterium]